jgi:XTP/dITP diphosphohydrolase
MNPTQRKARFHCVLVLSEGDRVLGEFPGVCEGYVALTPSTGPHGFGYDPLFVPEGYAETFGDLPAEVKARLSHRGKAVRRLHDFLATLG